MPFAPQYKNLIESEKKVSKALIKPRNIYRILVYEYADGTTKSLAGPKATLVFVIGVFQKQIFCLKLSEIKPDRFFKWLKKVFKKPLTDEDIDKAEHLMEVLVLGDKGGNKIYSSYVKPSSIAKGTLNPYRTYNLSGINVVQEISIKKQILKQYYK
jgi:hypothetical protein